MPLLPNNVGPRVHARLCVWGAPVAEAPSNQEHGDGKPQKPHGGTTPRRTTKLAYTPELWKLRLTVRGRVQPTPGVRPPRCRVSCGFSIFSSLLSLSLSLSLWASGPSPSLSLTLPPSHPSLSLSLSLSPLKNIAF